MAAGLLAKLFGPNAKLYRIACLYEDAPDLERPLWRAWPGLFDATDALIQSLSRPAFLKSTQYDPEITRRSDRGGTVTRFRKLAWSDKNNLKWVDDLAGRPAMQLGATEIWSPWVKDLEDRSGGPDLYLKVDGADSSATDEEARKYDWQSLIVALRHDRLAASAAAADELLRQAGAVMPNARLMLFDRGWAEHGHYTSFIRSNGLEDSYPGMLKAWLDTHPAASVASFSAALR
ncbi:hypothetical protein [Sphingomonas sp.]|uniref:hypothetical protein n=1 Tax=Sphingomonas sp. TaxID=28214 RepID=UPI00286E1CF5|nr:hypothetical protein [Sphingomonas sp.]